MFLYDPPGSAFTGVLFTALFWGLLIIITVAKMHIDVIRSDMFFK